MVKVSAMLRYLISAVLLWIPLGACPAWAQAWAQKMFPVRQHSFGTVARGAKAEFEFVFSNPYIEDVHIAGIRVSCGCASVFIKDDKRTLKTYEKGAIVARLNSDRFLGSQRATITVSFDRPFWAEVQLQVSGLIRSDLVMEPGSVQFGTVDQGSAAEKTVQVTYSGASSLRVAQVESRNPHLSARMEPIPGRAACNIRVRLDATAPAGYLKDCVTLVANDGRTRVPLVVEAYVVPQITVVPSALRLGAVAPGQKVTKQLVVKGKGPFRIARISIDGEDVQASIPGGPPKVAQIVPVTFVAGPQPGKIVRTIRIETDLGEAVVELSAEVGPDAARPTPAQPIGPDADVSSGVGPVQPAEVQLPGPDTTAAAPTPEVVPAPVPVPSEVPAPPAAPNRSLVMPGQSAQAAPPQPTDAMPGVHVEVYGWGMGQVIVDVPWVVPSEWVYPWGYYGYPDYSIWGAPGWTGPPGRPVMPAPRTPRRRFAWP